MATHLEIVQRWRDVVTGATTKKLYNDRHSNVFVQGDRIYSYGTHFEMARAVRDKRGKVSHFLVNGDVASVSTTRHQGYVRWALKDQQHVIIPYSALESAGIDRDSVKLLEVTADHWMSGTRRLVDKPWWWDKAEEVGRLSYYGYTDLVEVHTPGGLTLYEYTDPNFRHRLGESLIRAKVRWWDSTGRHERWATFLSGFDTAEATPLYFLAEMPYRCKATTVADAYQALKPEPVVLAEAIGREVQRQGDIFAIPAPSVTLRELRKMGARIERRRVPNTPDRRASLPYILHTNHTATEVAYLPHGLTLVRGTMYHDPQGRERDHARHTLGKTWHIVVKNSVPQTKRRAA